MRHPSRAIRVCFVIDNLTRAGTESQLVALIGALDRTRVAPYLCLLDGTGEESRALEPSDCPILRLGIRSLLRPATLPAGARFVRLLRSQCIDVVQVHFRDSTRFGIPWARLAGVPRIVMTRRNLGHWLRPVDRLLGPLFHRMAHATVANCEACRQAAIGQERASRETTYVLPNGILLDRFASAAPLRADANGRMRRVGMVANLRPVKAPEVFVRAAAVVAAANPNVTFAIAGQGDEASLRRVAEECGVAAQLELPGGISDVAGFLATTDVAVLSSHSEGLSNSLLEYMAAGRPIVATSVGGNTELIEHGVNGLLVPAGDPQALGEAIGSLLKDPLRALRLGQAARQKADLYSLAATAERHATFYEGLLHAG